MFEPPVTILYSERLPDGTYALLMQIHNKVLGGIGVLDQVDWQREARPVDPFDRTMSSIRVSTTYTFVWCKEVDADEFRQSRGWELGQQLALPAT